MQHKQLESTLLVHRPRKRRNYIIEAKNQEKSQNLKTLHQTLLCEETNRNKYIAPERNSVANLINRGSRNISKNTASDKSKEKQRPVNFYINIEKLKNLKISRKENPTKRAESSQSVLGSYMNRDKKQQQFERRSELLKNYGVGRKNNQSQEQITYSSVGKLSQEREVKPNKGRSRYKTQIQQEPTQEMPSTNTNKKAVFKRAHNELILKDKSFIEGYLRGKQLGRGGFSKVWQGFHFKSKIFYAIKEIDTSNKYQTHLTEIWFGNYFFQNGQPKRQYMSHPGINCLLKMYTYSIIDPRAFIVYESCNGSLGNMLYDIYEEDRDDQVNQDDKLYMIKYKPLYNELRKSTTFLRTMLLQIAQALDLLAQHKIVHSDIKTQNILMNVHENHPKYEFKLIDYGSSFVFQNLKQYKLATPEYMCPELLNYILYENKKPHRQEMLSFVKKYENTSAIDVWGLGCIVVQLIHGLPLWLSNKTKILVNGKYETKRGLFAVNDRSFAKILERQLNVIDNFDIFLKKENNSCIALDDCLKQIIKKMLIPDPALRIRPYEIIAALMDKQ